MAVPVADRERLLRILAYDLEPRVQWAYDLEQQINTLSGGGLTTWGLASTTQFAGNGDPNGVVTAIATGDIYIDETGTPSLWIANGAGTVWTEIGTGGGGGAPTTADYLVGTAQGGLSAEIVVGTTPGGELGNTWASPTVDATHSGSSHASVQAAAEATAAAALSGHVTDATDAHDGSAIGFHGDGPPVNGVNTIWSLDADTTPTTGTYKVEFRGQTSATIPFDATAAEAVAIIEVISTIGVGNLQPEPNSAGNTLVVEGSFYLQFINDLGVQDVEAFTIVDDTTDGDLSVAADQTGSPPDPVGVLGDRYFDDENGIEYTYSSRQGSLIDNADFDPPGWVPTGPAGVVFMYDTSNRLRGDLRFDDPTLKLRYYDTNGVLCGKAEFNDSTVAITRNDGAASQAIGLSDSGAAFSAQSAGGAITALTVTPDRIVRYSDVLSDDRVSLVGTADPSAGAGIVAFIGSSYLKFDDGTEWRKTGAGNTAWSKLETTAGAQTKVDAHDADTTSVHGIANTANLVLTNDSRLTDARTPTAHAASHQDGGSDELALDGSQITAGTIANARLDADLAALAGLTSAADKLPYFTGAGTAGVADFTAFARSLMDDANAAAGIATLGLAANLATFALPASTTISTFGASLIDDAAASNARTTLGLGTIATQDANNVSISGGAVTGITDLAIADGGTGASTAAAAFDALSPVTTRGDLIFRNATTNARLPKGTAGTFLKQGADDPAWTAIAESDVTNLSTDLTALQTQTAVQAAQLAAHLAAELGFYVGQGLVYSPNATPTKLDSTAGTGLIGTVEILPAAQTAIATTIASLADATNPKWVAVEIDTAGATQFNQGTAAAAPALPTFTASRIPVYLIYVPANATNVDTLLTTNNGLAKLIDIRVVKPGPSPTGWQYDQNTWVYASANTYTIAGIDATGYLRKGAKISYNDGAVDYGYVASVTFSTNTTVTVIPTTDYSIANATLVRPRFSYVESPQGFPTWLEWAPGLLGWGPNPSNGALITTVASVVATSTFTKVAHGLTDGTPISFSGLTLTTGVNNNITTYFVVTAAADSFQVSATKGGTAITLGGTADATITVSKIGLYRYCCNGTQITVAIRQTTVGTSIAAAHTITMPVAAATITNMVWAVVSTMTDNGNNVAGQVRLSSAGTVVNADGLLATSNNTASGSSRVNTAILIYEF